jgi:hypothetical protein
MKRKKPATQPAAGPLDPTSYVARMNQARKATNKFSKLMRPPQGWIDRFGFYSCYSKQKSPYKWDFIW